MKYVFLALIFISSFSGFSQRSKEWLKANKRGNRSEGKYSDEVGNPDIRLVSFVAGKEEYEFKKNQNLSVSFYSPDTKVYTIKAEELKPNNYYWMESTQSSVSVGENKFTNWPVDFLLKRMEVPSHDLGIVVRQGNKDSQVFQPAKLFHSGVPENFSRYVTHFYLGKNVSRGNYKVYKGKIRNDANLIKEVKLGSKPAGEPFSILFPKKGFKSEGWYIIELNLYKKGNLDLINYSFLFYHKP